MNKTIIDVPAGIKYISDWEGFELPDFPHIMDKQITGCGFTEWCITGDFNLVLASPRIILLENKTEQHPEVFYAKNDLYSTLNVDRDLSKSITTIKKSESEQEKLKSGVEIEKKKAELRNQIRSYFTRCLDEGVPCKILVTYDSYRIVYETLKELGCFDSFYTVVDEFQSIFTDSKFKSDTELEFLNYLKDVSRLCFVSATPMIDNYLDMLDGFKDLPFYELRWDSLDPYRIIKPQLEVHPCSRLNDAAINVVQTYLDGQFEKTIVQDGNGNFQEIESRELVVYVNSVKNICDIIRKAGLTYDNTNVLCSNSSTNQRKIRSAFGLRRGEPGGIGKVPLKHEPRKMFTLCTRTVYLGADFYSDNARSVILSDANIDCLAVDITLDLPQILGRQRLDCNPWKNRAELYAKFLSDKNKKTGEEFKSYQENKISKTRKLLDIYDQVSNKSAKHVLAEKYQKGTKAENYRDDYVAVNVHAGSDLIPVFNNLVMISEMRAFEIQQIDFADRFRTFNSLNSSGKFSVDEDSNEAANFLNIFNSLPYFTNKMKLLCTTEFKNSKTLGLVLGQIPIDYSTIYNTLSLDKIKALCYKRGELMKECNKVLSDSKITSGDIKSEFAKVFIVGEKYTIAKVKNLVREVYDNLGFNKSPKAVDILDYFEVLKTRAKNETGEKFVDAYKILKLKE